MGSLSKDDDSVAVLGPHLPMHTVFASHSMWTTCCSSTSVRDTTLVYFSETSA